ncbi:hypothetical protein AGMMS50256_11530 [Betaproteobacteria bacterium]|nr:hypothetical protein AGMMS50256_11530 [Betaproteobacteria bacterium]
MSETTPEEALAAAQSLSDAALARLNDYRDRILASEKTAGLDESIEFIEAYRAALEDRATASLAAANALMQSDADKVAEFLGNQGSDVRRQVTSAQITDTCHLSSVP